MSKPEITCTVVIRMKDGTTVPWDPELLEESPADRRREGLQPPENIQASGRPFKWPS